MGMLPNFKKLSETQRKKLYAGVATFVFLVQHIVTLTSINSGTAYITYSTAIWLLLATYFGVKYEKNAHYFPLATAIGVSACVGFISGLHNFDLNYAYYEYLKNGRKYSNTTSSISNFSTSDASRLKFADDTLLDVTRGGSWMEHGVRYCVAPITQKPGKGAPPPDPKKKEAVYYWAVGRNCCPKNVFQCDQASKSEVGNGIVVFDHKPLLQSISTAIHSLSLNQKLPDWLKESSDYDYYKKAQHKTEAVFGLHHQLEPTYVRWTADFDAVKNGYYFGAVANCVVVTILYCLGFFFFMAAFFLMGLIEHRKFEWEHRPDDEKKSGDDDLLLLGEDTIIVDKKQDDRKQDLKTAV